MTKSIVPMVARGASRARAWPLSANSVRGVVDLEVPANGGRETGLNP